MNIAVCINHVPDTAAKISIGPDSKCIQQQGVTYIINPYDEFAVEEALKWKEKLNAQVHVLSIGGDANKESIRKALAMGADEGYLLKYDGYLDSHSAAKILAEEIKNLNCELVFMGKQSIDYDNSITGQLTASILDYNCVTIVVDLKIDGNKITAEREVEGGREVVETILPAVITTQKGLNEPRYASLKGIMAAKKKVIQEKPVSTATPLVDLISLKTPAPKNPGKIIGSDVSAVPELVKLLKEEAKVI